MAINNIQFKGAISVFKCSYTCMFATDILCFKQFKYIQTIFLADIAARLRYVGPKTEKS